MKGGQDSRVLVDVDSHECWPWGRSMVKSRSGERAAGQGIYKMRCHLVKSLLWGNVSVKVMRTAEMNLGRRGRLVTLTICVEDHEHVRREPAEGLTRLRDMKWTN